MKKLLISFYYYILYLITPKSKLKVLYYAIFTYIKEYPHFGMCWSIQQGINKVYCIIISYPYLNQYFPEFNIEIAKTLFNVDKFCSGSYWWNLYNIKDRYNYFKYLVNIYKNKKENVFTI